MYIFSIHNLYNQDSDPAWLLQDATFEKMGVLMSENNGRLLGIYDELSAFLTKIKLYGNRGLSDSHELAIFLELYNANPWTRTTGTYIIRVCHIYYYMYMLHCIVHVHIL